MKTIHIIRHAESLANKGEKTEKHDTIPLSELGRIQARNLLEKLDVVPDLIITSSFTRTQETAAPYIERHKGVPIEVWEVEEFTYLDTTKYSNTTPEERAPAVKEFWGKQDITFKDAEHTESYLDFTKRVINFVQRVTVREEERIVIFSHGMFILTLKNYLEIRENNLQVDDIAKKLMELQKKHNHLISPIHNTSIHTILV